VKIEILLTAICGEKRKKRIELGCVPFEVETAAGTRQVPLEIKQIHLTPRETQVRDMILLGKVHKEIAAALHLSLSMVKMHAGTLYQKYGVDSRNMLLYKLRRDSLH
jgi:DNA-binding NarL/FixJ family response regulator